MADSKLDKKNDNPFAVLGVNPEASLDDIKKTYKLAALALHPDKQHSVSYEIATKQFQRLNEAYDQINTEEKLDAYKKEHTKTKEEQTNGYDFFAQWREAERKNDEYFKKLREEVRKEASYWCEKGKEYYLNREYEKSAEAFIQTCGLNYKLVFNSTRMIAMVHSLKITAAAYAASRDFARIEKLFDEVDLFLPLGTPLFSYPPEARIKPYSPPKGANPDIIDNMWRANAYYYYVTAFAFVKLKHFYFVSHLLNLAKNALNKISKKNTDDQEHFKKYSVTEYELSEINVDEIGYNFADQKVQATSPTLPTHQEVSSSSSASASTSTSALNMSSAAPAVLTANVSTAATNNSSTVSIPSNRS